MYQSVPCVAAITTMLYFLRFYIFIKLTNDILWAIEEHNITAVLALKLSATFDTVDHDILLQVLKNQYGIDGKALK